MKASRKTHTVRRAMLFMWTLALLLSVGQTRLFANPMVDLPRPERPVVELAICLDTSGSMSGLIDAAKQKLWAIVNDLALARPTPELRVALLTYGNDGHNPEDGWVAVQSPFTDDLDLISERLFALTTNGGTEYVGRVLQNAGQLGWLTANDGLRLVVVAGNESADQDPDFPFRDTCRDMIARGIIINAIYCGPATDGIAPGWREVAQLADGQFASIDHNHGTVTVETPFDGQLSALSAALNETYVPLGEAGRAGLHNQSEQDANASGLSEAVAASRAMTKASAFYRHDWDLVDALEDAAIALAEVEEEALPEKMQEMTAEEREAYVEEMRHQRAEIQKQIQALSEARESFVRDEMKKRALDDSMSFDNAVREAVRQQATVKGFQFEDPEAAAADSSAKS